MTTVAFSGFHSWISWWSDNIDTQTGVFKLNLIIDNSNIHVVIEATDNGPAETNVAIR